MSNMSYCKFQNTLRDLQDCYDTIDQEVDDRNEERARKQLVKLCYDIADEFEGNEILIY